MADEPWNELGDKLDGHIARFDNFEDLVLRELAGDRDPLTRVRSGGIRGDVGELKRAVYKLEHQADNGGINARLKITFWQKAAIATLPFATAGAFALLQALIEKN